MYGFMIACGTLGLSRTMYQPRPWYDFWASGTFKFSTGRRVFHRFSTGQGRKTVPEWSRGHGGTRGTKNRGAGLSGTFFAYCLVRYYNIIQQMRRNCLSTADRWLKGHITTYSLHLSRGRFRGLFLLRMGFIASGFYCERVV